MKNLFKAKRIDTGEWVEGSLIERSMRWGSAYSILVLGNDEETQDEEITVYFPTICQAVGRTNKSGKEVFLGDYDGSNGLMVSWCDKSFSLSFSQIDVPTKDIVFCNCYSCEGNFEFSEHIDEFESTGNIHD